MALKNKVERSEIIHCTLCADPKCTKACEKGVEPGKLLRNIWFRNEDYASLSLDETNKCLNCDAPCENACIKNSDEKKKVDIKDIVTKLYKVKEENKEIDNISQDKIDYSCLKSDICGIPIENPFLLSSSVVASTYDMCKRAFEAGWAGACFKTICNFDIHEASPRFSAIEGDNGQFIGFKNIEQLSDHSVEENMKIFRDLKAEFPNKFILASIMGRNEEEWEYLARECEENGADAVELNFSCPNMAADGMGSDIGQVPEFVEQLTRAAKRGCNIPVIAKLTPNVDNMTPAADAAIKGGADGIAAINTIKSITGVNLNTYVSSPSVHGKSALGGYSGAAVKPIALRFIMELGQNEKLKDKHISGMGGVESWTDAAEFILLGSKSIQITTAVMKYGYRIIDDLINGLALYMNRAGFKSISEMAGLGLDSVYESTDNLERDTIVFPKFNKDKCIGCGRCYISCMDGGHQAIEMGEDGKPIFKAKKCVGCHLCKLVCPEHAIGVNSNRFSIK